ncbi:hypothetical protein HDV04_004453 [Boothiomyces sp. JEL0838]|nr:hypothetical protein HDV04_004453 [Boothiomyces sp. JEL0838]
MEYISNWGNENNVIINFNTFFESAEDADYIQQVTAACKEHTGNIDLILMDINEIGLFKDCLADIYAWNFEIGNEIDPIKLSAGIDNYRLLALPFETFTNLLLYNSDYLSTHGYSSVPSSLSSLNDMFVDIQVNERTADNFKLSGLTTSFGVPETLIEMAVEWAAGSNSTLVPLSDSNSIATGNFSDAIGIIVEWINSGLIDTSDFSFDDQNAFNRWINRQSIFLHASTKTVFDLGDVPFNWAFTGMPGNLNSDQSNVYGNLNGKYIGVYKYSQNLDAAVKALQFLTSREYQSTILSNAKYEKLYVTPSYPFLYSDESICVYLNGLCSLYSTIIPAIRPSLYAGSYYYNVSSIISTGLTNIFGGSIDVYKGIQDIDNQLRALFHFHPLNYVDPGDVIIAKPRRKPFKYLYEQVIVLLMFIGVILTIVLLYRKKVDWDKNRAQSPTNPQTEAVNDTSYLLKKN